MLHGSLSAVVNFFFFFTILWWCLPHINMNRPEAYIASFLPKPTSLPSRSLPVFTEQRLWCPVSRIKLSLCSTLCVCSTYGNTHVWMLVSQIMPPYFSCFPNGFSLAVLSVHMLWKWSHSVVSNSLLPCGPILCYPVEYSPPAPPSMGFSGKNTGVGCHFLLQEIFPTQGLNPALV